MGRERQTYWQRFIAGTALYTLFILLQLLFLEEGKVPLYFLVPGALLPLVPAVWGMSGWLDALSTFDELQRRIHAEAGLFALAMTALATFGYGFLEATAGFPRLSMFLVFPLIGLTYFIGFARGRLRYA